MQNDKKQSYEKMLRPGSDLGGGGGGGGDAPPQEFDPMPTRWYF